MQTKVRSYPGAKKRVRRRHLAGDPGEREGPDPEVQGACDRVRAAWIEDGQIVSQTRIVPVQAGLIQAIYLRPSLASVSSARRK